MLGVSPDSEASHVKFKQKFDLPFTLLADPDHATAEEYGVWVEKSMYGKKYMGVERSTFVIAADGTLAKVMRKVKPETHADDVLAAWRRGGRVQARSAHAVQRIGAPGPRSHMRMRGLEPPRPERHTDLNRARLPIPPHPRADGF